MIGFVSVKSSGALGLGWQVKVSRCLFHGRLVQIWRGLIRLIFRGGTVVQRGWALFGLIAVSLLLRLRLSHRQMNSLVRGVSR